MIIRLEEVKKEHLPIFFEHQQDPTALHMAAFTSKEPSNWNAFENHWAKILDDKNIIARTIIFNETVAGHISQFEQFGEPEITYWIGKDYWGQGIATQALTEFLPHIKIRPLYARAAKDNIASLRVLEKCGFTIFSEDKGFANARGEVIEEYILKLEA